MSATIKGFSFNEVKPQPGFNATQGENGGWTGTHSFAMKREGWNSGAIRSLFAKGTPITDLDQSLPTFFSFMSVVEPEVTFEEGDIAMVKVSISGGQGAQYGDEGLGAAADPVYRLNGQLQDAPLSMHSKWAALDDLEKNGLGLLIRGQAEFDKPSGKVGAYSFEDEVFNAIKTSEGTEIIIESEDGLAFATLIASGETTYLRPTFTWTESLRGTDALTTGQINNLGNISVPRGDPPTPSGTRDWMLTSAFQEESGDLISTDLEWTLSEKGGHNEFLYAE